MAEACLIQSCPDVIRFSVVDPCTGEPQAGATNGHALACPRNWTAEPIIREGEASEFISDCGFVVARDKQDDQLNGWTLSFETAHRSNELQALLADETLIASGGQNIGTINLASLTCAAPDDSRVAVEAFYTTSRCTAAANHVRWYWGNAQFKITELDREGQLTFFRYTAETYPVLASGIDDGPYNDFPADVTAALAALPAGQYVNHLSFEEDITVSGSCGAIPVPAQV